MGNRQKDSRLSKKIDKKIILPILIIISASLVAFWPNLNFYFFQDDWFLLNWVNSSSLHSLLGFRSDIIYWRPLSLPVFFAINYNLFGINPTAYHLIALAFFTSLIISIYYLFVKLFDNKKIALVITFMYSIWPVHFISLGWLAATQYIIAPLFATLTFTFFLIYIQNKQTKSIIFSNLFYVIGLLSHESVIILPILILLWGLVIKGKNYLSLMFPMIIVGVVYVIIRIIFYLPDLSDEYNIALNKIILVNLTWYILWSLNLPESFKELININIPEQSFRILQQFWPITVGFITLTTYLLLLSIKKAGDNIKNYSFGLIWFILGISPFIFFSNHSFPMYLGFAGIGIMYLIGFILKDLNNFWIIGLIVIWIFTVAFNLEFTRATHWTINEQAISEAYVNYVTDKYLSPHRDSTFVFSPASQIFAKNYNFYIGNNQHKLKQSLNDQDAMQVVYGDVSIRSIYLPSDTIDIPKEGIKYEIKP